jgi:hypothetical protein
MQQAALTLVDDFLSPEKALEVRENALAAGFKDIEFMGGIYQGTGLDYNPPELQQAIEQIFGKPVKIHISAFRCGHEKTTLHVNIHSDNVIASMAGVYYLNLPDQCVGGTAFYSLKETGWDAMPTQEVLDASGHDLDWLRDKWTNPRAWDLISLAGMKFNRFIFYPTQMFHSRFPLNGWGNRPEESRLVWTVFFDILE